MERSFQNTTVLITGASGGIGSVCAELFHSYGANVILHGVDVSKLDMLHQKLDSRSSIKVADLSDPSAAQSLIADLERIDVVICNAGITDDKLSIRMSNDNFANVVNVNLTSTFIINREAIKKMLKQSYGRIINISSVVGFTGNPGQANYVASKAGVVGMTKALALEVAKKNITVNAIAPGFIVSPMTDKLSDEQKNMMLSHIPTGKFGMPIDVANACVFLAHKNSSYITGQTIHVNGGLYM